MDKDDRKDRPLGWWKFGMEFLTVGHDALDAMRSRTRARGRIRNPLRSRTRNPLNYAVPSFPIYYCFLQGVELGLKAYLRHNDIRSMEQLKKIGHDITKLLNIAEQNGIRQQLPWLTDRDFAILHSHSPMYKDKEFTYIRTGIVSSIREEFISGLWPIDDLIEVADKLLVGITDLIGIGRHPIDHPWVQSVPENFN